jgi:excisionase family DNA binding protein
MVDLPGTTTEADRLLAGWEVAKLFGVTAHTIRLWAADGALESIKTPGGHYRFWMSDIRRLLEAQAE